MSEKINWKQALLGVKGRMNPAMLSLWQYVRALIISKIWQDKNLLAHKRPGMNLDSTQVREIIQEGCYLAKDKMA